MDKLQFAIFGSCVAFLNVAFNVILRGAGESGHSFLESVLTLKFAAALCLGTLSAICLVGAYRAGVNLAQGIILVGATSIVVGTFWGLWQGATLHPLEWLLLSTIIFFYCARFFYAS